MVGLWVVGSRLDSLENMVLVNMELGGFLYHNHSYHHRFGLILHLVMKEVMKEVDVEVDVEVNEQADLDWPQNGCLG